MYAEESQRALEVQLKEGEPAIEPFRQTLIRHGLRLERDRTTALQVNVGFLCNQMCRHCHLDAGSGCKENMGTETTEEVISYAARGGFETMDITGGAPELNPNLATLIEGLSPLAPRIILRSNLSALHDSSKVQLLSLLRAKRVVIAASFPSLNEAQTNSQRGVGIFETSIAALQRLNAMGYGHQESGLELNLVSNPTGAFLAPSQAETEMRFKRVLERKWGIVFNNLFNFANMPLGRFRNWLLKSGNLKKYMEKLASAFNPCAVEGLMCRNMVTVSWDGFLYDCDFNLAIDLCLGKRKTHVSEMAGPPESGSSIAVGDHCYTCTAGVGFT